LPPSKLKSERENIKIIEFESLGCKIKNTKRFYIVNPTASSYEFEWRKLEEEVNKNNHSNYFKCITPKGSILSGKKFEVIFEYSPETIGTHTVYYNFYIAEFKLEQQFLI
jgi:hydrocephalus-inducing protein